MIFFFFLKERGISGTLHVDFFSFLHGCMAVVFSDCGNVNEAEF